MNHNDPDALARALGKTGESRRSLFAGLAGLASAAVLPNLDAAAKLDKKAKKKRKRRRRRQREEDRPQTCSAPNQCGKGCCSPDACFENAQKTSVAEPATYDCCKIPCKSSLPNWPDQCCYAAGEFEKLVVDEICDPLLPNKPELYGDFPEGICCRKCGNVCCSSSQYCLDPATSTCEELGTARLARYRRP
jgi:hypothetical protein